jgi:hypothetical protein
LSKPRSILSGKGPHGQHDHRAYARGAAPTAAEPTDCTAAFSSCAKLRVDPSPLYAFAVSSG